MFDGKFIATLIALVVAVIAICNFNSNKVSSNEGFAGMGHSFTTRLVREVGASQAAYKKGSMYTVPGTYQSMLSPRINPSQGIGSNIRFNMPSHTNMAAPHNPISYSNMAKENYQSNGDRCNPIAQKSYHGGAQVTPGDYAAGNYHEIINDISNDKNGNIEILDSIPVSDMTTMNALGQSEQMVVYDRLIYANKKSRNRALGDFFRGDLAIVPHEGDWFRTSAHPNTDLQPGALAVMGGVDNENTKKLASLIGSTSAEPTLSGVSMASFKNVNTGSQLANINVTAFP